MIEQIEMDKFCQGTIIDDHWIITAATCCRRHTMTPQEDYAKAFINFGATLSPFTPSTQVWLRPQLCATDHYLVTYKLYRFTRHLLARMKSFCNQT